MWELCRLTLEPCKAVGRELGDPNYVPNGLAKKMKNCYNEENHGKRSRNMKQYEPSKSNSPVSIEVGDITKLSVNAIVNAANKSLLGGGGVDGAIHRAAGPRLLLECMKLKGCSTGEAKITKGYNLKAKYVIHTVGPVYHGKPSDAEQLASCYRNSLSFAKQNDVHSIAFPAISTGVYGYPKEEAAEVALRTIFEWLSENEDYGLKVVLSCFDREMAEIYQKAMEK